MQHPGPRFLLGSQQKRPKGAVLNAPGQRRSLLRPSSTRTCTSEPSCASRSRRPTASPSTCGASASPSTTLPPAACPSSPSGDPAGTRRPCGYRGARRCALGRGRRGWGLQDELVAAQCLPAAPSDCRVARSCKTQRAWKRSSWLAARSRRCGEHTQHGGGLCPFVLLTLHMLPQGLNS